jgi:hypothetical protein
VGLRQRGWRQQKQEVATVIGEVGAVVGTSWGDDSSSKDDASKGGGVVVEPRSKIPQQPGKPAKMGRAGQTWQTSTQASRPNRRGLAEKKARRVKNPAWPQKARWPKKRKYQLGNLQ